MSEITKAIGQCATWACLLEALAPKAGNVHPTASFPDLSMEDFVAAAAAVGPVFEKAVSRPLGQLVFEAVNASRAVTKSNANLGIVLLIAPLVKAAASASSIRLGIQSVLNTLTEDDAHFVYQAIRLAHPGGMGTVDRYDVHQSPPSDLREAMKLAANVDRIARSYVTDFVEIFESVIPVLKRHRALNGNWSQAIRWAQVELLSLAIDSLILRKCGAEAAESVRRHAEDVHRAQGASREYAWTGFDAALRREHHRLNPGTTADLIAAGLFVILFEEGKLR